MASKKTIATGLYMLRAVMDFEIIPDDQESGAPGTIKIWSNLLQDLPDDLTQAAFHHISGNITSRWNRKPRPGDIREFVSSLESKSEAEAWSEVLAVAQAYNYQTIEWSTPVIQEAVHQMGGILALVEANQFNRDSLRKTFREAYGNIIANGERRKSAAKTGVALPAPNKPAHMQLAAPAQPEEAPAHDLHPDVAEKVRAKREAMANAFNGQKTEEERQAFMNKTLAQYMNFGTTDAWLELDSAEQPREIHEGWLTCDKASRFIGVDERNLLMFAEQLGVQIKEIDLEGKGVVKCMRTADIEVIADKGRKVKNQVRATLEQRVGEG